MTSETNPTVKIGKFYRVGELFWVEDDMCIGFTSDAYHGQRLGYGGSMYIDDYVKVIDVIDGGGAAVVSSVKHDVPYGASCPHGLVFIISIDRILSWEDKVEPRDEHVKKMKVLAEKYGLKTISRRVKI